jgi:catechol 2,3-dioxygenase-like lactoylglutathione lyase family enzyme
MKAEHIGIYANNVESLAQWYRENLDFVVVRTLEKEGRPPIYFLKGEEGLMIEILPTSIKKQKRDLIDPGYSHIGIVVDDFDRAAGSLKSRDISLHDVRKTSNGWTIGYLEDPEGNRLELVHRPQEG